LKFEKNIIVKINKQSKDERFLNHRVSNCSKRLKIEPCRKFVEQFAPDDCILYVGIDWEEFERAEAIKKGWLPYSVEFPLCWDKKWISKVEIFDWLTQENLIPPRLYGLNFAHANCGGFCVKAGKAQFKNLLKHFPLRYQKAEEEEEEFRQIPTCENTTILREMVNGEKQKITLKELRERLQSEPKQLDLLEDWSGCGCFTNNI
jgi:hypothetical protein